MKITEEQFNKLYSKNISKREYDSIILSIDNRSSDIILLIRPDITKNGFFVYDNYNHKDERDEGFFDIDKYKCYIIYGGKFSALPPYFDSGLASIPTRWLWTDDGEILKEFNLETKKYKERELKEKELAEQKREELKQRRSKFRRIIESKLTKEELKYIYFK